MEILPLTIQKILICLDFLPSRKKLLRKERVNNKNNKDNHKLTQNFRFGKG